MIEYKNICNLYTDGSSIRGISHIADKSQYAIRKILNQHNIIIRNSKLLSHDDELNICNYYLNDKLSISTIAKQYNCRFYKIANILNKHNINHSKRKYLLNESIFNKIDSSKKAYLLGFIYADGSVSDNVLRIGQSGNDSIILYKLRDILETDIPIYKNAKKLNEKQSYCIAVTSKNIINNLNHWGIVSNKTFKIEYPTKLNKNYIGAFIRGYFDGDGYFYIRKNRKAAGCWAICSNEKFCNDIQFVLKESKISSSIYKNKTQKIYELRVYKFSEILKLYNLLYYNSNELYIPRKKQKFTELFDRKGIN